MELLGRLSGETAKNGTKALYERTLYYFAGAAANSTGTRVSADSIEGSNWSDYWEYAYNADGIRTQKTVDGVTTRYTLNGTQIPSIYSSRVILSMRSVATISIPPT